MTWCGTVQHFFLFFIPSTPVPHIDTMFHILLALVFKNQPWKTGTFSKVCLVSNGCEESQSSRVSCRLRFHCICCLRYTHSGNCKLPESHNTQMKKKIPQIKGTHIQWKLKLVESGWNWWRSILREFSFFLFLMFLSASHKKPASQKETWPLLDAPPLKPNWPNYEPQQQVK